MKETLDKLVATVLPTLVVDDDHKNLKTIKRMMLINVDDFEQQKQNHINLIKRMLCFVLCDLSLFIFIIVFFNLIVLFY